MHVLIYHQTTWLLCLNCKVLYADFITKNIIIYITNSVLIYIEIIKEQVKLNVTSWANQHVDQLLIAYICWVNYIFPIRFTFDLMSCLSSVCRSHQSISHFYMMSQNNLGQTASVMIMNCFCFKPGYIHHSIIPCWKDIDHLIAAVLTLLMWITYWGWEMLYPVYLLFIQADIMSNNFH